MSHSDEQDAVLDERAETAVEDDFEDDFEDDDFSDTDVLDAKDFSETAVLRDDDDDYDYLSDSSAVFEVADILAEFEEEKVVEKSPSARVRRRLEAIAERRRRHQDLIDFNDYELDF